MNQIEWPYPSNFFETGEGRMHYVDAGPKDAQRSPVVLVHGTPVSSLVYRRFIARLSTDRRVIAVDHLGFGRSDKRPDADFRRAALAGPIESFLGEIKLERPVLVENTGNGHINSRSSS